MVARAWHQPVWERFVARQARLPHALLLIGAVGVGTRELADRMAARLLCVTPVPEGDACGQCAECRLLEAGSHPDRMTVTLSDRKTATGRAVQQISIDELRGLQQALTLTAHRGGRRVIVVDPAEALSVDAANALLKLLEEPPDGCVFLLTTAQAERLLPTIRSRCQQWHLPLPDADAVRDWLQGRDEAARALLHVSGGLPLEAERLHAQGAQAWLKRFVRDLDQLARDDDPLALAGNWEKWLKSKESLEAGWTVVSLFDWLHRWVTDLTMLRLGAPVRYFVFAAPLLNRLSARTGIAAVLACQRELTQARRLIQHPLNSRLLLEDLLIRYQRMFETVR